MDEEKDIANWVIVDDIDCAEEAFSLNSSENAVRDSDQESDGSFSIISDQPTDGNSDDEQLSQENNKKTLLEQYTHIGLGTNSPDLDLDILFSPTEVSSISLQNNNESEDVKESADPQAHMDDMPIDELPPRIPETSVNDSELVSPTKQILECPQEGMLEVFQSDTDYKSDSAAYSKANLPDENGHSNTTDKEMDKERPSNGGELYFIFMFSVVLFLAALMLQDFLKYQQQREKVLVEPAAKIDAIIRSCLNKEKLTGDHSDFNIEKCLEISIKIIRNKFEKIKKIQVNLQTKERILKLKEKELVRKEKEIFPKCHKQRFAAKNCNPMHSDLNEKNVNNLKHHCTKLKKDQHHNKEAKSFSKQWKIRNRMEKKAKYSRKYNNFDDAKIVSKENKNCKKGKCAVFDKEKTLLPHAIKELKKIKKYVGANGFIKWIMKDLKVDLTEHSNEEWYLKYNPDMNKIQLINITALPEKDLRLIKKGNKTLNGQWYFSLYDTSRAHIRSLRKLNDWYFKRGRSREDKRNKAKWYFDYTNARDDLRHY